MKNQKSMLPIVAADEWLLPVEGEIQRRYDMYINRLADIEKSAGTIVDYANGHRYFGWQHDDAMQGWWFREWLPEAKDVYIFGDFNNWQRTELRLQRNREGVWSIFLPDAMYGARLVDGSLYKLHIHGNNGWRDRIPAYAKRVVQDETTKNYTAQFVIEKPYDWKHDDFRAPKVGELIIYEAHVGMAQEKEGVGSYIEFRDLILPRIKEAGYNAVQLMAIAEHPYYGSFGYHVSNFFAVSSRQGTPEELKHLIADAHAYGMDVIMDIVHSHAVKNELEGLGNFDGTPYQYFHDGARREHPAWDSLCFDYGKTEVLHFLLSNCKFWMDEYDFDGFRFDGVTSMIYKSHGLGEDFVDYSCYYNGNEDGDAICYLTLANKLIHEVKKGAITIAEDMSGMPGLACAVKDGGMGFDYRLAMGIPDFWIKYIKEVRDEDWKAGHIFYEMTNRREDEKTISYAESHDQALVGDKTIIFRLCDADMYWHFEHGHATYMVDRGLALHKMIRLITASTINGGYLNFMGNEFGHPEWIDFPREGNGWSHKYARRQWSLVDNERYFFSNLNKFDEAMVHLLREHLAPVKDKKYGVHLPWDEKLWDNEGDQVMAFQRGNLVFVFNWNGIKSFEGYGIPVKAGKYKVLLNTDAKEFAGFGLSDDTVEHFTMPDEGYLGKDKGWLRLYLPARSAIVLELVD